MSMNNVLFQYMIYWNVCIIYLYFKQRTGKGNFKKKNKAQVIDILLCGGLFLHVQCLCQCRILIYDMDWRHYLNLTNIHSRSLNQFSFYRYSPYKDLQDFLDIQFFNICQVQQRNEVRSGGVERLPLNPTMWTRRSRNTRRTGSPTGRFHSLGSEFEYVGRIWSIF